MATTQDRHPTIAPFSEKMIGEFRDQWAETLRVEIKAFEAESRSALAAMKEGLRAIEGNGVQTSRAGNGHTATTKRTRSRPSRAKASTGSTPGEAEVLDAIRRGKETSPAIAGFTGSNPETILRRLKALEGSGVIRREGERAKTRWLIVGQPGAQRERVGRGIDNQPAA
jgi:hypothetical protein